MGAAQNLKPWRPGQSGNPGGKPALPAELKVIKALTKEEAARIVSKYARMRLSELEAALSAPERLPMLDAAIMRVFQEAFLKGDFLRLSFLLDRAIGKVAPVETNDEESKLAAMNDDELTAHVRDILKKREGDVA